MIETDYTPRKNHENKITVFFIISETNSKSSKEAYL